MGLIARKSDFVLCKQQMCRPAYTSMQSDQHLEGFPEKSLKNKYALKSTGKSLKGLEKSLNSSIFCST